MHVLGIDPGSHRCGYAVVDFNGSQTKLVTHGCFDYPSGSAAAERFIQLEQDITRLCQDFSPEFLTVESLFFNKNTTTAMRVAEARGVIILAAAKQKRRIVDCTPLQVKMAVTGYGRADKKQIKHMIELQFKNETLHKLDDAVDAIGIALTGHSLYAHERLGALT